MDAGARADGPDLVAEAAEPAALDRAPAAPGSPAPAAPARRSRAAFAAGAVPTPASLGAVRPGGARERRCTGSSATTATRRSRARSRRRRAVRRRAAPRPPPGPRPLPVPPPPGCRPGRQGPDRPRRRGRRRAAPAQARPGAGAAAQPRPPPPPSPRSAASGWAPLVRPQGGRAARGDVRALRRARRRRPGAGAPRGRGRARPPRPRCSSPSPTRSRRRSRRACPTTRRRAAEDLAGGVVGAVTGLLFKKRSGASGATGDPPAVRRRLGRGQPLPGPVAARMGEALGDGFADVQVHTDVGAGRLAGTFDARAFTVGSHIAFAPGEYRPGTLEGDALIAHELAHVAQQRGARPASPARRRASRRSRPTRTPRRSAPSRPSTRARAAGRRWPGCAPACGSSAAATRRRSRRTCRRPARP